MKWIFSAKYAGKEQRVGKTDRFKTAQPITVFTDRMTSSHPISIASGYFDPIIPKLLFTKLYFNR